MKDKNIQEFHAALMDLQSELNRLTPARQQIEEVNGIAGNVVKGMNNLTARFDQHLSLLVDQLDERVKLFQDSMAEMKAINERNIEDSNALVKGFLSDFTESGRAEYANVVKNTKDRIEALISDLELKLKYSDSVFNAQNEQIKRHLDIYENIVTRVEELTKTISNIDFPSRLDKVDLSVSAINIGLQNVQSKLETTSNFIGIGFSNSNLALDSMKSSIEQNLDNFKASSQTNFLRLDKGIKFVKIILIAILLGNFAVGAFLIFRALFYR